MTWRRFSAEPTWQPSSTRPRPSSIDLTSSGPWTHFYSAGSRRHCWNANNYSGFWSGSCGFSANSTHSAAGHAVCPLPVADKVTKSFRRFKVTHRFDCRLYRAFVRFIVGETFLIQNTVAIIEFSWFSLACNHIVDCCISGWTVGRLVLSKRSIRRMRFMHASWSAGSGLPQVPQFVPPVQLTHATSSRVQ